MEEAVKSQNKKSILFHKSRKCIKIIYRFHAAVTDTETDINN
ncbi:MAG: hypothetical protein QXR19_17320 [Candidatus Jordarchaeaceae archaeon]